MSGTNESKIYNYQTNKDSKKQVAQKKIKIISEFLPKC